MTTVFVGGSRRISRLPEEVKARLDNVMGSGHAVLVGDANGADKAVQKHFIDAAYQNVTVFSSGPSQRNNLGAWSTRTVQPAKSIRGFQFYAAKDRAMAQEADFGLMIWDGKSPGTILNVLRLVRFGKIAVLFSVPKRKTINFKTVDDWRAFIAQCSEELRSELHKRATSEEWDLSHETLAKHREQSSAAGLLDREAHTVKNVDELAAEINEALSREDPASVLSTVGRIAKLQGMSQVAKDAGLARESLYRSLTPDGNPEFATILKVLASLGLRLQVEKNH